MVLTAGTTYCTSRKMPAGCLTRWEGTAVLGKLPPPEPHRSPAIPGGRLNQVVQEWSPRMTRVRGLECRPEKRLLVDLHHERSFCGYWDIYAPNISSKRLLHTHTICQMQSADQDHVVEG